MFILKLPNKSHNRVSSDSAWPLRRADGKTWAEAKAEKERSRHDQ